MRIWILVLARGLCLVSLPTTADLKGTGKREPGEINAIPWGKLEEAAAF